MQTGGGKRRPATAPDKLWPWPEVLRGGSADELLPEPVAGAEIGYIHHER